MAQRRGQQTAQKARTEAGRYGMALHSVRTEPAHRWYEHREAAAGLYRAAHQTLPSTQNLWASSYGRAPSSHPNVLDPRTNTRNCARVQAHLVVVDHRTDVEGDDLLGLAKGGDVAVHPHIHAWPPLRAPLPVGLALCTQEIRRV